MEKVRIGIICPSEIAYRRFMPAIQKCGEAKYIGVAYASAEEWFGGKTADLSIIENEKKKAESFRESYGGKVFESYAELIKSDEIDAVYLPLPPALHFKWAKAALENGKHIFLEKPSTTSANDTKELIDLADKAGLAVHENYMFMFHRQLDEIKALTEKIGEIRLYRIAFGFPQRAKNDFRYNREMGGGALLDCGGYTIKLASEFLGESARVVYSKLNKTAGFDVDIYGSAALVNDDGVTAQLSFGMDNGYKCELEIWGSKGSIKADRIFTAPEGFEPTAKIQTADGIETVTLSADDTFKKSIEHFCKCVNIEEERVKNYRKIIRQAELVEAVKENGN